MLTVVNYDSSKHTFYARLLQAHATGGSDLVLLGKASPAEIRAVANKTLAAPECGDFDRAGVVWTD